MDRLKPRVREALKEAHTDLTDEVIDLSEELLAQRFLIDPEADPERLREIDRQRAELLRNRMPKYREVLERMREDEHKGGE
jgi:hypothetical protein